MLSRMIANVSFDPSLALRIRHQSTVTDINLLYSCILSALYIYSIARVLRPQRNLTIAILACNICDIYIIIVILHALVEGCMLFEYWHTHDVTKSDQSSYESNGKQMIIPSLRYEISYHTTYYSSQINCQH